MRACVRACVCGVCVRVRVRTRARACACVCAPINVSPQHPLPGEVRQSWGFDLIRIQLPHPPGNVRIQILTGHALRVIIIYYFLCVSHAHFSDSISRPLGQACHSKQGIFPTLSRVGGVGANIDRRISFLPPCASLKYMYIRIYHVTEKTFMTMVFDKNALFRNYRVICFLECHQPYLSPKIRTPTESAKRWLDIAIRDFKLKMLRSQIMVHL